MSSITKNANSVNASTESGRGTLRWRAPELLQLSGKQDAKTQVPVRPTKESDMYSFAMVVVEVTSSLKAWSTSHLSTFWDFSDIHGEAPLPSTRRPTGDCPDCARLSTRQTGSRAVHLQNVVPHAEVLETKPQEAARHPRGPKEAPSSVRRRYVTTCGGF